MRLFEKKKTIESSKITLNESCGRNRMRLI